MMKRVIVYRGKHTEDSKRGHRNTITVDFQPLPHIMRHSPTGFSWGYSGSGPADAALSILAHHFGETDQDVKTGRSKAAVLYQAFKNEWIAKYPQTLDFQLTSMEIETCLKRHAGELAELEDRLQFQRASQS